MSRILELAKTLEAQSKQAAEITTESVSNVIKQHEQDLIAQLQDARTNIENVIQTERRKLINSAVRLWRLPSLIMGGILLLMLAAAAFLVWQSSESYQEMQEWKQAAENYQAISQSLKVKKCKITDTQSQYCIEIDKAHKGTYWGEKGNLAILPVKVKD